VSRPVLSRTRGDPPESGDVLLETRDDLSPHGPFLDGHPSGPLGFRTGRLRMPRGPLRSRRGPLREPRGRVACPPMHSPNPKRASALSQRPSSHSELSCALLDRSSSLSEGSSRVSERSSALPERSSCMPQTSSSLARTASSLVRPSSSLSDSSGPEAKRTPALPQPPCGKLHRTAAPSPRTAATLRGHGTSSETIWLKSPSPVFVTARKRKEYVLPGVRPVTSVLA
jgi:hypothetical protein